MNPLLDYQFPDSNELLPNLDTELPMLDSVPGEPYAEEEIAPPEPSPQASRIMELAASIAKSVVSLRAWDEYGGELATGSGCFVNQAGLVLTDISLVLPRRNSKIAYLTMQNALGQTFRVEGIAHLDLDTGITLLQTDAKESVPLAFAPAKNAPAKLVTVLGLSNQRGLILADATMETDDSVVGAGWLRVRGKDTPAAAGSPVLDEKGRLRGLICLKVQMGEWLSFATPLTDLPGLLAQKRTKLLAWSDVPEQDQTTLAADPAFLEAYQVLQEGKAIPAALKLLKLVRRYPRSAELWSMLGLAAARAGDKRESLACQQHAVALDPTLGIAWRQMAMQELGTSKNKASSGSYEALRKAAEANPNDGDLWLAYGYSLIKAKRWGEANAALLQAGQLRSSSPQVFLCLGYVKSQMKDWQTAEQSLQRAVELDRKLSLAWVMLGTVRQQTGRLSQAVEAYDAATRAEPNSKRAWLCLAHALRKYGNQPSATAAFRRYQELSAKSAQ